MEECRHCGASFDEETPYLEHLRDEHEDDLGTIEQRRIAQELETDSGAPTSVVYGAVGVGLLLVGLVAYALFFTGGGGGAGAGAGSGSLGDLADSGDPAIIDDVETIPSPGNEHISRSQDPNYQEIPPTGGPHYSGTVEAGFYEQTPALGDLVHTLEHGAVVVYYDESQLSDAAEQDLKQWAANYTGTWSSVVVVPHPDENPENAYVLTAWEKKYTMSEYDSDAMTAFAAEFLGRGPENPVR